MKFEIDDKTGMVQHEDAVFFDPTGYSATVRTQNKKSFVK